MLTKIYTINGTKESSRGVKNTIIFMLVFVLYIQYSTVKSQEIWNLSKCINYALDNNIDLNIKRNQVSNQEINLLESKANLFPDLNLGSGLNVNYGRTIDGNTNDITYNQTISNNLWINSSVDIFQGLVKHNTISFNKFLLLANKEESEFGKNRLIFEVITAYYISLYSVGLVDVANSQVQLSEMQYLRMDKLVKVGKESPLKVQDLKSQWVADKLNLTKAQNQKNNKLLELKQLLRLNAYDSFTIDTVKARFYTKSILPKIDSLYTNALSFLPEIKQQELLLSAAEKDLAISRGNISPRLYLSAGLSTNYFDGDQLSYYQQIEGNRNQHIVLGLVIPIFNNAMTYSSIKRKKIAIGTQQLQIEKQEEQVYTEIWKALDNTNSAEKEYLSAVELYTFSKLSFQNTSKKLENGLANTSEFEIAKQRLVFSEVAKLKAELTYQMYQQILEFYKTGNWNHLYQSNI